MHERYWEVPRLLCFVVGCGTDWQQETRSSVFLIRSKEFAIQLQDAAPALSQRRRTSVIFAACRCTGILFVPDFNGQILRYAFPHRYSFENLVSLVDRPDLFLCRSGSDLRTGVANRGGPAETQRPKQEKGTALISRENFKVCTHYSSAIPNRRRRCQRA